MINLILADDHAVVRKGLELFIRTDANLNLLGQAADGIEVLKLVKEHDADVLLLDLDMPKTNGISIIRKLRDISPDLKVIILTMHPENVYGKTAYQMGANAYLLKDDDPEKLIRTIYDVNDGKKIFSQEIIGDNPKLKPIKLSRRESEVLRLLSSGMSNKNISEELDISDKTVSTYKLRLLNKIGAKSLVDLVNFANNYPQIYRGRS